MTGGRAGGLVMLLCAGAVVRLSAQTSLTIYSDNRVLVRRSIAAPVARGASLVVMDPGLRDVDPATFVALDSGVEVRGVRHSAALGFEGSLRRAVGRDITFRTGNGPGDFVMGTVLSADPVAVRVYGQVMHALPGTPVFPDSLVQLEPRVELALEATAPRPALRLLYLGSGLSWSASYSLTLPAGGSGRATVAGAAALANNASLSLRGAEVQLLAGDVRRAGPSPPVPMARAMRALEAASDAAQEAVGGTHLYTLPGTVDFVAGETRTVPLFGATSAATERELVLDARGYGFQQEWPDALRDIHPEIAIRVRRPAGQPAGSFAAIPLPGGVVRVYQPDQSGRPQLLGEVAIDHTPAGRDLRLVTGSAFDVTGQKTQTEYRRPGEREAIMAFRVELQNAGAEAASVLVTDHCPAQCEILSSSIRAERPSAFLIGFRVPVPAGGSATLEYRLRARW